ncbi:hypothetical protein Scep_012504 [Stephania cephalantha]|uniref:Uncharacterized protein n=1 Tax=Stephania cephalantha TaxID=152367 RepID=A0AAP0JGL9_9MAGN
MANGGHHKTVLIIGVGRGLGRALAIEMAGRGHTVFGFSRDFYDLESLRLILYSDPDHRHVLFHLDVCDDETVSLFAHNVIDLVGVPDIIGENVFSIVFLRAIDEDLMLETNDTMAKLEVRTKDNRVTDHRLKMNLELTSFLDGDIETAVQLFANKCLMRTIVCCAMEQKELLEELAEDSFSFVGKHLMRILNVAKHLLCRDMLLPRDDTRKPFNPLLGETYEADYPDKGLRFFSEKVSHHPMIVACHCEGRGWKFWGDSNMKSKFWGRSIQLDPVGMDCTMKADIGKVLADALRYYYFDISQFNQSVIGDELTTTLKAACSCFDKLDFVYLFRAFLRHDLSIWIYVPLFMIGKEVLDPKLSISSSSEVKSSYCMTEIENKTGLCSDQHDVFVLLMPYNLLIFKDEAYSDYLHGIEDSNVHQLDKVCIYAGVVNVEGITYVLEVPASLFVEGITVVQDSIFV